MKQQEENKESRDYGELTETYIEDGTIVEVYGELNIDLFAESLYKLFIKKGIDIREL